MKKIMIVIMLFASLYASAQIHTATVVASGLTCSMCSRSIYKALEKVSFIKTIDADVEKSAFVLGFREGAHVSPDEIKKAVENAGFSVASMVLSIRFEHMEVYNDARVVINGDTYHFLDVPRRLLTGEDAVTMVDKGFLSTAAHRKYGKYTKMDCFNTGVSGPDCPSADHASNRVYHVTL